MKTIDLTPSWAGLMPALIAALQCGGPEGQAIAREELGRLAASVDAQNARVRSGAAEEERNQFGLESVALGRERAAADLARAADDFRATGAFDLAAAYFEAAARIVPTAALAHDYRAAGAVAAARASADLTRALQEARESGAAEALPEAQAARAKAIQAAHAEGRRAGMEEARGAVALAPAALLSAARDAAALLGVAIGGRESLDHGQARATIRDLKAAIAATEGGKA